MKEKLQRIGAKISYASKIAFSLVVIIVFLGMVVKVIAFYIEPALAAPLFQSSEAFECPVGSSAVLMDGEEAQLITVASKQTPFVWQVSVITSQTQTPKTLYVVGHPTNRSMNNLKKGDTLCVSIVQRNDIPELAVFVVK